MPGKDTYLRHMNNRDIKEVPVVILCGGKGTRLREQTEQIPKPLVRIGNHPIVWHIMKIYHTQGFRKFILLLGYKGEKIKEYFLNYSLNTNDFVLTQQGKESTVQYISEPREDWEITFLDTGEDTMTGGRIKQLSRLTFKEDLFMMTYGDGVANVDLHKALNMHDTAGKLISMTCVPPIARFGEIRKHSDGSVQFHEKPAISDSVINGGFFIANTRLLKEISDDASANFESDVLPNLARAGQLNPLIHEGYWQCMDTMRDCEVLNTQWESGNAPWKIWH